MWSIQAKLVAYAMAVVVGNAAAAQDLALPGPYSAGWTDVPVTRPEGGSFTATLYYPATTAGSGAPYDDSGAPYAAVSFGHGFLQPVSQYESTLEHLATWGYFAIATQSYGGILPDHAKYAADLRHCLTWLEEQNTDASSELYEQVDVDCFALSGHSMGGGASILATAADLRVRVLVNLAAAETNPSAIDAMADITVPVRLIAGSDDAIVPPESHGDFMYANGHAPKQHAIIQGGFHCGFVDEWFLFCDSGAISRQEQLAITRRLMTAFLNLYLQDDQALWPMVWGPLLNDEPLVVTERDVGIALTPAEQELEGSAGTVVSAALTVQNTAKQPTSYTLLAEDSVWATTLLPPQTPVLQPGESFPVEVEIVIAAEGGETQTMLLSARSDLDGGTRGYATVIATRLPGADITGDGVVDVLDLLQVLGQWGTAGSADVTGDGIVDVLDLLEVLGAWGPYK